MVFLFLPAVSKRDPIIKHERFSSRADNGRGLILRLETKIPCYNQFITYSKPLFRKNVRKKIKFYSEIENYAIKLCNVKHFILFNVVTCGHDNLSPFKIHNFRVVSPGRLKTQRCETQYHIYKRFGEIMLQICDNPLLTHLASAQTLDTYGKYFVIYSNVVYITSINSLTCTDILCSIQHSFI